MTPADLDARLAAVPAGALPAPRAAPANRVAILDYDNALSRAEHLPVRTDDDQREDRSPAARHVLERLPDFLRAPKLETRVTDRRLLDAARVWRWGAAGLVFVGVTGIGKSTAAALAYRAALARGWREGGEAWERAQGLRWFSAHALGRARREHSLGHGDAPEIVKASRATLLVLDDVGWDRDPSAVSDVLAERYERQLPTIVTSGRKLDELEGFYQAAVIRRLVEAGGRSATVVDCFAEARCA